MMQLFKHRVPVWSSLKCSAFSIVSQVKDSASIFTLYTLHFFLSSSTNICVSRSLQKITKMFFPGSLWRCSLKMDFLKIVQYSQENTSVWVFFHKSCRPERGSNTSVETPTQVCFSVNIAKILREPFLKNICEQLLLDFVVRFG